MSRQSSGVHAQGGDRVVVLASGTTALQPEVHANRLLVINTSNALHTLNLPRATGSGDTYEFLVALAMTSNIVINAVGTAPSNVFVGNIFLWGSTNTLARFASTTNDIITLNQTTTGGYVGGDYLKIMDTAPNQWRVIYGMFLASSASQATPFSG